LREGIGRLLDDEPLIEDEDSRRYIYSLEQPPYTGRGRVKPFDSDGPLMIMTGRLARQKGVHILLKALEEIISRAPETRILLLLLPVWSDKKLLDELVEASMIYTENMRILFGRTRSIYGLAHLSANIMIAPSIYEPFGLMALEAMASGTPVVASRVGGLAETVLDMRLYGVRGTGLHIEPGDPKDLAGRAADLLLFMETQYIEPWTSRWYDMVDRLEDRILREILLSNPRAPWIVRGSCIGRAGEYNWDSSADKALEIYGSG
jgi:glycogen synthase